MLQQINAVNTKQASHDMILQVARDLFKNFHYSTQANDALLQTQANNRNDSGGKKGVTTQECDVKTRWGATYEMLVPSYLPSCSFGVGDWCSQP
jgi:hypothetical protein